MKSRVDRINELFSIRVREAIETCRLEAHAAGKHGEGDLLSIWETRIRCRTMVNGTYERLELDDIIKGHKRAWPE